ncbi:hypothetical protein [Streptomyces parvulus]|uniref:hypothetical protein n=1 Tax=Streptomyces parvulus TaxID=146923 RepID=UPI0037F37FE1
MKREFSYVDLKAPDAPVWWAMVQTPYGVVPVRVESWTVTEEGVTPKLASLRDVDTNPGKVSALRLMGRDEAWAQVAEWSKAKEAAK